MLKKEILRPPFQFSAWQRMLLIGVIVSLTSQLYLSVWAQGFRVSAAVILYPVLLMTLMRSSHRPWAGLVTGLCVTLVRVVIDLCMGQGLATALRLEYPGGVFYLCYDCLLCLLIRDRRAVSSYLKMGLAFWCCDFCSNLVNLLLSSRMDFTGALHSLPLLAGLALARAVTAAIVLWSTWHYHLLLLRQEHERRYQRLFVMTADLKNELYFLKKDSEDIEGVMSRAYRLYERLGELNAPQEEQALALAIAREVHEIKKDNLRIIRGLEGEVADAYDQEEMGLSDLIRILEDTTRRMLGEQRSEVRLECWCGCDVKTSEHYRLLSILKNLVTNAVEAIQGASGRGTVRVDVYLKGEDLILRVRDNGPGISERAQKNLFQVGYSTKFDPDTGNISRGVGLPAVEYIVKEFGGTIQVESQPDQGSQFTVALPLKTVQEGVDAQ